MYAVPVTPASSMEPVRPRSVDLKDTACRAMGGNGGGAAGARALAAGGGLQL